MAVADLPTGAQGGSGIANNAVDIIFQSKDCRNKRANLYIASDQTHALIVQTWDGTGWQSVFEVASATRTNSDITASEARADDATFNKISRFVQEIPRTCRILFKNLSGGAAAAYRGSLAISDDYNVF